MKAICLAEPKRFELIEIDDPAAPAAGEALVRVARVGICGTDISGYLGKMPFYSYPRIPGHELGVTVVAVGEGVTNVKPGDRCSVEPYINCQECFACRQGRPNCCDKLQVLGVHIDGGMRPQFIVPARKLHPSAKLELDQLALVETLAIGCHAADRGAPQAGENVLVIGAGPIGLATIEFVKLTGATLTVMDVNEQRLAFCKNTMGVDHTIRFVGDDGDFDNMKQVTEGNLFSVVIDATGNPGSMCRAFEYCAHTGRLVYVGLTTSELRFQNKLFHAREITLYASRNALPHDFGRIIQLIEEGKINTKPWITHRTPMAELIERFESYTRPETGAIKAMVEIA